MRTTVRLDDALVREAKMRAAEQGITFTRLIDESLRERLARPRGANVGKPADLPTYGRKGTLMGVDLGDNRAVRDLMDDDSQLGSGGRAAPRRRS